MVPSVAPCRTCTALDILHAGRLVTVSNSLTKRDFVVGNPSRKETPVFAAHPSLTRQGCPGKISSSRNKCLQRRRLWKSLALSTRDCELESFESLESFPGTALPLAGRGRILSRSEE